MCKTSCCFGDKNNFASENLIEKMKRINLTEL